MFVLDPIKCYLIGGAIIVTAAVVRAKKKNRLASWTPVIAMQNIRRPASASCRR